MMILSWNSPKITVEELDFFLRNYLSSAFDGVVVNGTKVEIYTFSDLTTDQEDYIRNWFYTLNDIPIQVKSSSTNLPFASKTIETSSGVKKLYKRVVGKQFAVDVGLNTLSFTIDFDWVKINGIEFLNSETLEKASLSVYDTSTGTYSTIPDYKLNQFGFDVNLCHDFYRWGSEYDADLYRGMIIKIEYTSTSQKSVGVNYMLNEVK